MHPVINGFAVSSQRGNMKTIEKYSPVFVGGVAFLLLWLFLQANQEFLFYYREQQQLFMKDVDFIRDRYTTLGGLSLCLAQFLVQFFSIRLLGAAVTAGIGVLSAMLLWFSLRKLNASVYLFPLCFVPWLFQVKGLLDYYYHYEGVLAFFLSMLFFWIYTASSSTMRPLFRIGWGCLFTVCLYLFAGSIALLFAVMLLLYDVLTKSPGGYWQLFSVLSVAVLGMIFVHVGRLVSYRFAYTNDFNYEPILVPLQSTNGSWFAAVGCMLLFFLARYVSIKTPAARMVCTVVLSLGVGWGYGRYAAMDAGDKTYAMVELQHYVTTEQWNALLRSKKIRNNNYLIMNYVNLALSQEGKLLTRLLDLQPRDPQTLLVGGEKTELVAELTVLLSDIYYRMGIIASAQDKAFDSSIGVRYGSPAMLKLLVKTNLIYGAYPVAEKYISVLERTWGYGKWATSMRRFLYDDEAVEQDPELGMKRRDLPATDAFSLQDGVYADLVHILETNPKDMAARDYAVAHLLLSRDRESANRFVERFYGTDALKSVPQILQEAMIVFNENDMDFCRKHGVTEETLTRYDEFKRQFIAFQRTKRNPAALKAGFGKTYWYYFLFNPVR